MEGRVDCGFLRLRDHAEFETIFLEQDRLLAVLPEGHVLTHLEKIPVAALCDEPFMFLEKGEKTEISDYHKGIGDSCFSKNRSCPAQQKNRFPCGETVFRVLAVSLRYQSFQLEACLLTFKKS